MENEHLTKEQIEAEGWKHYQTMPNSLFSESYTEYCKDIEWYKVVISYNEKDHYLDVQKVIQNVQVGDELKEFRNTIYNGNCKDIETFRTICKLINI